MDRGFDAGRADDPGLTWSEAAAAAPGDQGAARHEPHDGLTIQAATPSVRCTVVGSQGARPTRGRAGHRGRPRPPRDALRGLVALAMLGWISAGAAPAPSSPHPTPPRARAGIRQEAAAIVPIPLPGPPTAVLLASPTVGFVAANDRLYRTGDGGRSWQPVFSHCAEEQMAGLPCGDRLTAFAALGGAAILTAARGVDGIWRSGDGGRTWRLHVLSGPVWQGPWMAGGAAYIAVEAPRPPRAVPGGAVTLERSTDGQRWTAVGSIPARDPVPGSASGTLSGVTVLAGGVWAASYPADQCSRPSGLAVSTDSGRHWRGTGTALYGAGVPVSADTSRWVMGGPACAAAAPRFAQGLFVSDDAGHAWRAAILRPGLGPLAVSPRGALAPAQRVTFAASPGALMGSGHLIVTIATIAFANRADGVAVGGYDVGAGALATAALHSPVGASGTLALVTADGGATWALDAVPGGPVMGEASCAGVGTCLLASPASTLGLLLTSRGGEPPLLRRLQAAWADTPPTPAAPTGDLAAAACPSLELCRAVGIATPLGAGPTRPLVETWRAGGLGASVLPMSGGLTAIACPAPTRCLAVGASGRRPLALRLDGTTWTPTAVPVPPLALVATLGAVSCAGTRFCLSLGEQGIGSGPTVRDAFVAEAFDGSRWHIVPAPGGLPTGLSEQYLACPAIDDCYAVGAPGTGLSARPLLQHFNGHAWTTEASAAPGLASQLDAIACAGPTTCRAVGWQERQGLQSSLVEELDPVNRRWLVIPSPNLSLNLDSLRGVACTGPFFCLAAGQTLLSAAGRPYAFLIAGAGGRWVDLPISAPEWADPAAVACASRAGEVRCLAVGAISAPTPTGAGSVLTVAVSGG